MRIRCLHGSPSPYNPLQPGPRGREGATIDEQIDPDILAMLSPQNLVAAYSQGVFPMVENGRLMWFSPDPRGLMPLDERFYVSRRLGRTIRSGRFECTVDRAFERIVGLCGDRGDGSPTWISPEIRLAYLRLHELGLAHSVEAWRAGRVGEGDPVGGLYGVALGGGFFAESMFHTATDAGKVAAVFLVQRLRDRGYALCDIQWTTPNLSRFGAFDMPREQYLGTLGEAIDLDCRFI